MKKFLCSALLAFPLFLVAQSTQVTLEDLNLAADQYYNGSDLANGFTSSGVHFSNVYDEMYGSWSGFAYSSKADTQTAGWGNQFSAITGSGAANSQTYGLFSPSYAGTDFITFSALMNVQKIQITNTTYAYLSMKDGDAYSKQFGSSTDANGIVDGTEGKDFFALTIYAHDANDQITDSVVTYLADFRFDQDSLDYILNSWKEVELNLQANKLSFKLTSSDNGDFGMNTPAYFAFDNLEFHPYVANVKELNLNLIAYPNPAVDEVTLPNYEGEITIFSMDGTKVFQGIVENSSAISIGHLTTGLYRLVGTTGNVTIFKK